MNVYEIKKELKKWNERVIFDVGFKENTKANLERLDTIMFNSLEHFVMIAANSEALVYKIGKYFIQKGVKNDNIEFLDGNVIKAYIDDNSYTYQKRERIDDFYKTFGINLKHKWVLIPYMCFEVDLGIAIYFISQLRKLGATGVIFYSEGPSNMTEVLSLDYDDLYFYEYPIKKYRKRKRVIVDDEY